MQFERFDSVFDALADTLADSPNLEARFELMSALQARIQSWDVSQTAAATRLAITRPRLNALLLGKLRKFSLDALVNLTAAAGLVLEIRIEEATSGTGQPTGE